MEYQISCNVRKNWQTTLSRIGDATDAGASYVFRAYRLRGAVWDCPYALDVQTGVATYDSGCLDAGMLCMVNDRYQQSRDSCDLLDVMDLGVLIELDNLFDDLSKIVGSYFQF